MTITGNLQFIDKLKSEDSVGEVRYVYDPLDDILDDGLIRLRLSYF